MKTFRKNEKGGLEVVETTEKVEIFNLKDLRQQRKDFKEYSDAELDRFDLLIAEAKKLNLKEE
jgi:hypothetical protein